MTISSIPALPGNRAEQVGIKFSPRTSAGVWRRLSDLVALWSGRHGHSLRDGEARQSKLLIVCDPLAVNFSARDFAAYREARLSGDISDRRASPQKKQGVTPMQRCGLIKAARLARAACKIISDLAPRLSM